MRSEVVVFNGIKYRRYPDSKNRTDRVYFTPGNGDRSRGIRRLHEEIWMANNGAIPEGFHIHHKDGNSLNNAVENLACINADEHRRAHAEQARRRGLAPERLERLERIRPLAKAWHSSEAGRAWHREHAISAAAQWKLRDAVCEECGAAYQSKRPGRFCSSACKQRWGYHNAPTVSRLCAECGATYQVKAKNRGKFCSLSCSGRAAARTRYARVRPVR